MPLNNNSWVDALKGLQPPQSGGIMPPAQPGNMGNMPYSPGMMSTYSGPQAPLARDLYRGQPAPQTGGPGPGGPPAQTGQPGMGMGMSMPQAQGLIAALTSIIRSRMTPQATQGRGPRY